MKEQIINLFLAVVMMLGLLPTAAVAYTGSQKVGYTVTGAANLADLLFSLAPAQHYPMALSKTPVVFWAFQRFSILFIVM